MIKTAVSLEGPEVWAKARCSQSVVVPFLRRRPFILQNKDEKNQILTTNVWLNLVSGRSRTGAFANRPPQSTVTPSIYICNVFLDQHAKALYF